MPWQSCEVRKSEHVELSPQDDGRSNKRLERTRHERASLLSCLGEPLKRSVGSLPVI